MLKVGLLVLGFLVLGGSACSASDGPRSKATVLPIHDSNRGEDRTGIHGDIDRLAKDSSGTSVPTSDQKDRPSQSIGLPDETSGDFAFGIGGTVTDDPGDLKAIGALLTRYDDVVTKLALDPVGATVTSSVVRVQWAQLVPADSSLSEAVLAHLVFGPATDGTRLLPGAPGVSFRHHVDHTGRREDGSIEFSWCGYSPGIRVETRSNAIVDDKVAHLRGIGRADRDPTDPQRWLLDSLDQLDMVVRPAGTKDPCSEGKRSPGGR